MHKAKTDVPVLLIFFSRDKQFQQVFEQVKLARPTKLYLYQDGARPEREDDIAGIHKCRVIADDRNIDWECEVHRLYQKQNFGCDPSEFIAQKWMFDSEEYGIVLEDDDVPSQSFFPYCKELLERYKEDEKINIICGMNNTGVSTHLKESYLFTLKGSIWGWASWKRVIDTWDGTYSWVDDPEKMKAIETYIGTKQFRAWMYTVREHKKTGREHYESIMAAAMFLNKSVNIVPKYNMISNIGIAQESTHSVSDIRLLPKRIQKLLYMKTYDIGFPLVHPEALTIDAKFEKQVTVTDLQKAEMLAESFVRSIRYLGFKKTVQRITNKVKGRKT